MKIVGNNMYAQGISRQESEIQMSSDEFPMHFPKI